MDNGNRIIPEEWFYFEDWLKERADRASQNSEHGEENEYYNHYEFVRREWVSHIADTIRKS